MKSADGHSRFGVPVTDCQFLHSCDSELSAATNCDDLEEKMGDKMKRRDTDPGRFALLQMLDNFAREHGLSIDEDTTQDQLMLAIEASLRQHRGNRTRVNGFRIQSMFAHIAAALGECEILTEEDSGTLFETDGTLRRPDYRVVTRAGTQLFIETKNHHTSNPTKAFRIGRNYLNTLVKYANLFKTPLKFAVYWSRWKLWTLTDSSFLPSGSDDIELSMCDAMKMNEMNLLGDCMLGTVPPLTLRLYADPTRPRSINDDGTAGITIARATVCADGREITEAFERKLAWFFMLYGDWQTVDHPAEIIDGKVEFIELAVSPNDLEVEQGFSMIGYLSSMVSRQYSQATSENGRIHNLIPNRAPEDFGILIPLDYKGKDLRLWRFIM